jgi:flagellar FliL protein
MAAPHTEPAPASEEKPPREAAALSAEAEAPPAKAPGAGWKAWMPLAASLLIMPAVAYSVTTFLLVPKMQKTLRASLGSGPAGVAKEAPSEGAASKKAAAPDVQLQNVNLNKLLVNVAGTMGSRYLLTSMVLAGRGSDFPAKVAQNEPRLRDMASGLLSVKTLTELEKLGARNMIRGELLAGFNSILGNSAVQEIYFTEFAIQ